MTCVAATVYKGFTYIGADSCASGGDIKNDALNPKVFRVDEFIFGCTSSFRMIDLLSYSLEIPKVHPEDNIEKFMRTKFINAVRECMEEGGALKEDDSVESGGNFLVGYKDKLYEVQNDFSVITCRDWGNSVGSGSEVALGSLYTTKAMTNPVKRLTIALEAASEIIVSVRGPFNFISTEPDKQRNIKRS